MLATATAPTSTSTAVNTIGDTGVYLTTTAGQVQLTSLIATSSLLPDAAVGANIGTAALPWGTSYGKIYEIYGAADAKYGSLRVQTAGTADTQGDTRLTLGNATNAGTANNARGTMLLYGTNTGYTYIVPGNNSTSNVTITLPSATGSLPVMSKGDTSYWGLCPPDGGTGWIRTTSSGIIPSANGSGALGTSSWQFSSIYGQTIYENGTALSSKYAAASHGTHLTIGTGASNAAAGNHTHSYAGSSSAGGAATSANKVNTNLIIKLNGGSTEGTNLFTFNGSAAKTINITASSIGAAASSHGTHLTIGTGASNAAAGNHTHNYAGSSSAGGAATSASKLATARTLTIGATGKTFDGSGNVSWSMQEIMKGQGLNYDTACNTLYFNNAGTAHKGRVSVYNNGTDDFLQLGLCTADARINTVQLYPTITTITKAVSVQEGGVQLNSGKTDTYYAFDAHRKCTSATDSSSGTYYPVSSYDYSTARFGCVNSFGGCAAIETRHNGTTVGYVRALPTGGIQIGSGKKLHIQASAPTSNVANGDVWIDI